MAVMTPAQLAEHEELAAWACLPLGEEQSEAILSSARDLALEVRRLQAVVDAADNAAKWMGDQCAAADTIARCDLDRDEQTRARGRSSAHRCCSLRLLAALADARAS